ncbi:MAG: Dam family site-specific DNA-(adenine-N6)-methyltransferase, partial [Planctomycetes bacterium]|nr:Dam family site-specific DNA-(adenine-N6)-methyltransferase [Planctomycetota bacterium]
NRPLVECYRAVRDEVEAVIRRLSRHRYDRDYYYAVRDLDPAALALAARAARWIYLNHACFNGLWRVNSRGRFNVPFGRHVAPTLCDAAGLRTASAALEGADIAIRDFRALPNLASAGDFVYLDPPYHPLSATARFTAYTAESFTPDDQADLAGVARALAARGCLVMLSNSDTPLIRDLYDGAPFNVTRVIARRSINRDATRRAGVPELVVRNYPT